MKKIIAILQQKGGVGKTTISVNIAVKLAQMLPNQKVLIIDADKQKSASIWLEKHQKVDVVNIADNNSEGRGLTEIVKQLSANIIIIDLPPALEAIALRAALIAQVIIIPVGASALDVFAAKDAVAVCKEALEIDPSKKYLIVPSRLQQQTISGRELKEALSFLGNVSKSSIGLRIAFADAAAARVGVSEFAPGSIADKEITELTTEIYQLFQ